MKIVPCGSMSAHQKMSEIKGILESMGHFVTMPTLNNLEHELDEDGNRIESAHIKIKDDLIRKYYEEIKVHDVVLIINPDKKDIKGYVGGNAFLEMGFAHVLGKKLYVLQEYSRDLPYVDEINAMQPIILNEDFSKID